LQGLLNVAKPAVQARFLDLHEYQSKALMAKHGVRVQRGEMATTAAEAEAVANRIKSSGAADLVLKSQILAGGRGKGVFNTGFKGGVKVVSTPGEVGQLASKMLGNHLITKQTGPEGQLVSKVLVHEGINFKQELYFAIILDRAAGGPCIVASPMGGVDIEEVAEKHPEQIFTQPVDITKGIQPEQTARLAKLLGFKEGTPQFTDVQGQMKALYDLFIANDCSQVEINPLVVSDKGLGSYFSLGLRCSRSYFDFPFL
jgi:succinyl-CoA synthetase beta subunit